MLPNDISSSASEPHRRRRRTYDALTYSYGKRKQQQQQRLPRYQNRKRDRIGIGKKSKSKSRVNLFDAFKVFASLILLVSSCITYMINAQQNGNGNGNNNINNHYQVSHGIMDSLWKKEKDRYHSKFRKTSTGEKDFKTYNDVYGIIQQIEEEGLDNKISGSSSQNFFKIAKELRDQFASRYGGEAAARDILRKGISTFHGNGNGHTDDNNPFEYTARRMQMARKEKRDFRFGFAGYSVTAGRGNYFHQSFPFVLDRILQKPMKELGINLSIINAGIGGVPSFPYGLCLGNFLGEEDPLDVVSWDFSMNEPSDAVFGIEAYIRQVLSLQPTNNPTGIPPMLFMKDTHMAVNRSSVIREYVEAGALHDPIIVHTDPATEAFLNLDEKSRPIGFQKWREFGAPPNAPGKSLHHPAKQEHEFIGWLIAMHFLSSLELLALSDMDVGEGQYHLEDLPLTRNPLPAPIHPRKSLVSRLLYGEEDRENGNGWRMEHASCRTSFDPIVGGDLRDIVTSTTVDSLDIMLPKGAMFYNSAWVLDLGDSERKAKQQLARFDGLGFVDSKKAFYGVHASGNIEFFLERKNVPLREGDGTGISSVIVCESNEKRRSDSCIMDKDMKFSIGGTVVESEPIDFTGFTYLGKSICVHMTVPSAAKLTKRKDHDGDTQSEKSKTQNDGLVLEASVRNARIRKKEQACCISHVIWV